MDKDETPIGGLAKPLQPTPQLFFVSVIMDIVAIIGSLFINTFFALGVALYILASRAYSYRGIRLKKYPVLGFLTVFIFQGGAIFYITYYACYGGPLQQVPLLPCLVASLLVGASYPLTQVYQHQQDKEDGVTTISYVLGKRGTFIFSMALFLSATFLLYYLLKREEQLNLFWIFLLLTFPVVAFFTTWMFRVWKNEAAADFRHSLKMNIISTFCLTAYFTTLIYINHFE
jgi:1,4-dihydroxy-2-naphthoate octaprenyltransferase